MDPMTGVGLLIGLFQLFQHERDKSKAAAKEEFFEWLITHNFQAIKEEIETNTALLVQIENLVKLNQDELLHRFDIVDEQLMRILSGFDEFRGLVTRLVPQVALSKREEYILTKLVESGESELVLVKTNLRVILQAGGQPIEGYDPRFVDSNLMHLAAAGYIQLQKTTSSAAYYLLTESGADYVLENKQGNDLSPQAKGILRQFYQSEDTELLTFNDEKGQLVVQTRNFTLVISEPNYVQDDLDMLEKQGLIKCAGALRFGGRRYLRTRKGEEYAANMLNG